MTTFETLSLLSSVAIGAGQIGIIWYGIRAMNRSSEERAKDRAQREAGEQQRAAWEDQRHAEAMQTLAIQRLALETLIERTAPPALNGATDD